MQKPFQKKTKISSFLAQSAAELAIFGSIVIFVISLIFRTGFSSSQTVNMELSAFRKALLESYKTSYGYYGTAFKSSRAVAIVMVIEDRLDVDPSKKQGTRDRAPLMAQGTGMMSNMLFYEKDPNEVAKVTFFDLYINGVYFPLTTSGFAAYTFTYEGDCDGSPTIKLSGPNFSDVELRQCSDSVPHPTALDIFGNQKTPIQANESDWDPSVGTGERLTVCQVANCIEDFQCIDSSTGAITLVDLPCARIYTRIANGVAEWCDVDTVACNNRFDLDMDGDVDVPYSKTYIGPTGGSIRVREDFAWQWRGVNAVKGGGLTKEEWDVDGDWDEEEIQSASYDAATARATTINTLDPNEGDVDFSKARKNVFGESSVGLGKESSMTSFTDDKAPSGEDGTSLRLQEGTLFGGPLRYSRSETRQENIDFIERVFYLSGDIDRFCSSATAVRDWASATAAVRRQQAIPYNVTNPVEACSPDCFSSSARKLTCIDTSANPPVLFIRTRLHDQRRRSWLTRVTTGEGDILQ